MGIIDFLLVIVVVLPILLWLTGCIYLHDFSVPTRSLQGIQKLLIIFPHADDETLTVSGVMRKASEKGIPVTWVLLTKGERGNQTETLDLSLKTIRASEVKHVSKLLHVSKVIQEDFGDGQLYREKTPVKKFLTSVFQNEKPDLVITYDLSGWYGHPDHIATTQVIQELIDTSFTKTQLWYVSLPKKVWALAGNLPTHMAKTPEWISHRTFPNAKVFVGLQVFQKIQSVYQYTSQYQSFRSSIPYAMLPMWFFVSMGWYEYFTLHVSPKGMEENT